MSNSLKKGYTMIQKTTPDESFHRHNPANKAQEDTLDRGGSSTDTGGHFADKGEHFTDT
jgi:hypothetical protein